MEISHRGRTVQASPIRKFKPYADAAIKAGVKVYFLNIGDPDIPTPKPILDAVRSFNDPILSYGPAQGFLELREAIAGYFGGYGIALTPTTSSSPAAARRLSSSPSPRSPIPATKSSSPSRSTPTTTATPRWPT